MFFDLTQIIAEEAVEARAYDEECAAKEAEWVLHQLIGAKRLSAIALMGALQVEPPCLAAREALKQ